MLPPLQLDINLVQNSELGNDSWEPRLSDGESEAKYRNRQNFSLDKIEVMFETNNSLHQQ